MNDDPCLGCHRVMHVPVGYDPTDYCNECAQAMVPDALRYRFLRPHLFVDSGGSVNLVHNSLPLGNEFNTGRHRSGAALDSALSKAMFADTPVEDRT